MTTPTPDCLRQEARAMRAAAKRARYEGEEFLERARLLNKDAQAVDDMAEDLEELRRIQALAGRPVRLAKKERVA